MTQDSPADISMVQKPPIGSRYRSENKMTRGCAATALRSKPPSHFLPGVEPRSEAASAMLVSVVTVLSVVMDNFTYFSSLKAPPKGSQGILTAKWCLCSQSALIGLVFVNCVVVEADCLPAIEKHSLQRMVKNACLMDLPRISRRAIEALVLNALSPRPIRILPYSNARHPTYFDIVQPAFALWHQ